jgi:hypothetical protein
MASEIKPAVGRPSLYRKNYCDLVIEACSEGKSLTAFAADIGVSRDTVSEWVAVHEEFSVAVKIAKAKCAAWWEEKGRLMAQTGGGQGQVTAVIFGLKNMAPDDWREKIVNEHTGKDGGAIETKELGKNERGSRIALALRKAAAKGTS